MKRLLALGVAGTLAGCTRGAQAPVTPAPPPVPITFEDVTRQAGVGFRHTSGAAGKKYLPETMGAGCAIVDVDADGRDDLLLVDGTSWPGSRGPGGQSRLYRNLGEGRYDDVTAEFGVPGGIYGMGVTAGDYDNDGFIDLFVSALGECRLLRNERGRRFRDVTRASGLRTPGWPSSAAWLDYDRDGRLDLFVCHYVPWTPATDVYFSLDGTHKSYARPDQYPGAACQLFRNLGGRFEDVSAAAGVNLPNAKSLGVALCDIDRDGWVDLAVSNDTVPNFLFHNQGNGTFKEVAMQAGVAVSEGGRARAGMGIDAADYDGSGYDSILISNFAGEQLSLYRRDSSGLFMDVAARAGIGMPSQRYLGFGALFVDVDLDGHLDISVANGHIQDDVSVRSSGVTYAQAGLLFLGTASGTFIDASSGSGALSVPRVARGLAQGDLDEDGDPDLLMTTVGGPPALLRQTGRPRHHWVRLKLVGKRANRCAIGAFVRLKAGGREQTRMVRGGSSYLSQSSLKLTFGLGSGTAVDEVEVRWPDGTVETYAGVAVDRETRLVQRAGG